MTINNNNIFGAFTLNEARGSRLTGDWLNKESVANYGWFGSGLTLPGPAGTATVDRIDFSNDSVSALARGPLSLARHSSAATGNSNYGWFGGGFVPGPTYYSTVDRVDFSNDSSTTSVRGPLSSVRYGPAATGNSNYGWFGGGMTPAVRSTVDRIDFSNDSPAASVRGSLSLARHNLAATGNSNYGWFGGGYIIPSQYRSTVDRIDFSNDSSNTSVRGPLSSARYGAAATGNSNYGWFGGGFVPAPVAPVSTIDRIDFSNDSGTASVRGPLSSARSCMGAIGNSNYGWFGGGGTFPPFAVSATVNRIDFSNDSITASPRGSLSLARYGPAATSGVLNIRRQKAGNYGWFGGGYDGGQTSYVDRIDFSNDSPSAASPRGLLTNTGRQKFAATGNSNYGWFGGGTQLSGTLASVDRIDFSNDLPSALVRGPLSSARYGLVATGNSNYGWFGGGSPTAPLTSATDIVDRINFSNDSSTASPRGPLSVSRYALAATGNSNYGWFGGGIIPASVVVATVDRINFSNDNTTISIRGPLFTARYGAAATGNSNYGWFGGGVAPGIVATVNRIDFSNDSVTASPRGPLSQARISLAATGNSNYGWFGGGSPAGFPAANATNIVDRINFANDSVSASPRGLLTQSRNSLAATSNTPIG